jgi:hypothetical protein
MRWRRPVWKDMAQMATASATTHLGPRHAVAFVLGGINGAFNRIVEAWPTSATIEFLARSEEPLSTSGADEGAGTLFVIEGATAWHLGPMRTHDSILFRRENAPPLFLGMGDFKGFAWYHRSLQWAAKHVRQNRT